MRRFHFVQYDVFTEELFGGNQLAVFPDAVGLSDEEMQAIAREMNYSETTFVLPPRDPKAHHRVRIFTPSVELPFAGHPTIGTTFALAAAGRLPGHSSPILLELGVGTLPVDVLYGEKALSFAWMHQPIPSFEPWTGDQARLLATLGVPENTLATDLPIERGSAGVPYVYIPLRSLDAIAQARPAPDLSAALHDGSNRVGAFVFTLEHGATGADVHGRMFAPGLGVAEDAATGSAAGPLGVYLLRHGRIQPDETGEARLWLEQGVEMGRPSRIAIAITGSRERVEGVRVGGASVLAAEGDFLLP